MSRPLAPVPTANSLRGQPVNTIKQRILDATPFLWLNDFSAMMESAGFHSHDFWLHTILIELKKVRAFDQFKWLMRPFDFFTYKPFGAPENPLVKEHEQRFEKILSDSSNELGCPGDYGNEMQTYYRYLPKNFITEMIVQVIALLLKLPQRIRDAGVSDAQISSIAKSVVMEIRRTNSPRPATVPPTTTRKWISRGTTLCKYPLFAAAIGVSLALAILLPKISDLQHDLKFQREASPKNEPAQLATISASQEETRTLLQQLAKSSIPDTIKLEHRDDGYWVELPDGSWKPIKLPLTDKRTKQAPAITKPNP